MFKKNKTLFYLAIIISILWHLLLLLYFVKFAFKTFKKTAATAEEKLLSETAAEEEKRYDTQIIFTPKVPIKKEGEEIIQPEEGEEAPILIETPEPPQQEQKIEEEEKPPEIKEEPPEEKHEEEVAAEGKQQKDKETEKKEPKETSPLDKETLKKLALNNLIKPSNPVELPETQEKPTKKGLLPTIPEKDNRILCQIEGLEIIGETVSQNTDKNATLEEIQRQAKWMCYMNKLVKPLKKELYDPLKTYRGKVPVGKSVIIRFLLNKNGRVSEIEAIEKCGIPEIDNRFKKSLNKHINFPPIPNHLEKESLIVELELSFPSSYNFTGSLALYH